MAGTGQRSGNFSKPRLLLGVSFFEYIDSRRHDSVVPSVGNRAPDSRGEVGSHLL
jgi:hypothetical protein